MQIELLTVPDCAHAAAAQAVLAQAARRAGLGDVPIAVTVIRSDRQARTRGFVGSPTFLINGADPFSTPGGMTGLACRMYSTRTGLSGVPELGQLLDALLKARSGPTIAGDDR